MKSFGNLEQIFRIPPFPYFRIVHLGAHGQFENPGCLLSSRKGRASEERKREYNAINKGHYIGSAAGKHMHLAWIKIDYTLVGKLHILLPLILASGH